MLNSILYFWKRKAKNTYKPVILITGCGSGIGWALARILSKIENYRIVLTVREKNIEKMSREFIVSDRLLILPLDVTIEKDRNNVVEQVTNLWGGIDILINNAGISYRSVVEHMTEEDENYQMQVNYFGPMALTRLVFPGMRKKGRGKIINVSSVSGMLAMPTMSSYSASKYALEGASEALWYEAKIMGINISLVQPGFIKSNSFQNIYYSKNYNPKTYQGPYLELYKNMEPFVARMMNQSFSNPGNIAKVILKVIRTENPPLWIAATWDAFIFYYLRRVFPRKLLMPFLFWCLPNSKIWGEGYSNKRKG